MLSLVLATVDIIGFSVSFYKSKSLLSAFFMYLRATFGFYTL